MVSLTLQDLENKKSRQHNALQKSPIGKIRIVDFDDTAMREAWRVTHVGLPRVSSRRLSVQASAWIAARNFHLCRSAPSTLGLAHTAVGPAITHVSRGRFFTLLLCCSVFTFRAAPPL